MEERRSLPAAVSDSGSVNTITIPHLDDNGYRYQADREMVIHEIGSSVDGHSLLNQSLEDEKDKLEVTICRSRTDLSNARYLSHSPPKFQNNSTTTDPTVTQQLPITNTASIPESLNTSQSEQPQSSYFLSKVKSKLKHTFRQSDHRRKKSPPGVSSSLPTTPTVQDVSSPSPRESSISLASRLTFSGLRVGTFPNRSISSFTASLRSFHLPRSIDNINLTFPRRSKSIITRGQIATNSAAASSSNKSLSTILRRSSTILMSSSAMSSVTISKPPPVVRTYLAVPHPNPRQYGILHRHRNKLKKPRPTPPPPADGEPLPPPPLADLGILPYPALKVQTITRSDHHLPSGASFTITIFLCHPGQKVEYMMDNTNGHLTVWVYAPHKGFEEIYTVVSLGGDHLGKGIWIPGEFDWNGLRVKDWGSESGKYVLWFPKYYRVPNRPRGYASDSSDDESNLEDDVVWSEGEEEQERTIAPPESLEVGEIELTEEDIDRLVIKDDGWGLSKGKAPMRGTFARKCTDKKRRR